MTFHSLGFAGEYTTWGIFMLVAGMEKASAVAHEVGSWRRDASGTVVLAAGSNGKKCW